MIHLRKDELKIKKAHRDFVTRMQPYIFKRIDNLQKCEHIKSLATVRKSEVTRYFDTLINSNIDSILGGTPEQIDVINRGINEFALPGSDLYKAIKYVFNYSGFIDKTKSRYCAYDLALALEMDTCTYCNRNYTNTIITRKGEKLVRPQFDHFFNKDKNPLLALSFYNLIPSCSICNTNIKLEKEFNLFSHIHPYLDDIIHDFSFSYDYSAETKSGLKILVMHSSPSKIGKTFEDMSLEIIYNSHIGELKDLLDIRAKFSDKYLAILSKEILTPYNINQTELYRLAFGAELLEKDFYKRPLSKFKKDILKELNIVI